MRREQRRSGAGVLLIVFGASYLMAKAQMSPDVRPRRRRGTGDEGE